MSTQTYFDELGRVEPLIAGTVEFPIPPLGEVGTPTTVRVRYVLYRHDRMRRRMRGRRGSEGGVGRRPGGHPDPLPLPQRPPDTGTSIVEPSLRKGGLPWLSVPDTDERAAS